jgi:hypothetical protein
VWICGFVPIFDRLKLVEIIWALGREPEDAAAVLGLTVSGKGIDAACARAQEMFAAHPDAQIAATMGWLQIQHNQNLPAASQWPKMARQADCEDTPLLGLELFLSEHLAEYDTEEIVTRILARNDLPMQTTRDALLARANRFLKQQHWPEAQAIADRILAVEENPQARWIRWITAMIDGDDARAQVQLSIAQSKMSDAALRGFVALGWLYMGDEERAKQVLQEAHSQGQSVALVNKDLVGFFRENNKDTEIAEAD